MGFGINWVIIPDGILGIAYVVVEFKCSIVYCYYSMHGAGAARAWLMGSGRHSLGGN